MFLNVESPLWSRKYAKITRGATTLYSEWVLSALHVPTDDKKKRGKLSFAGDAHHNWLGALAHLDPPPIVVLPSVLNIST